MSIYLATEIESSKIGFSKPVGKKGYHQSSLVYDANAGLTIQSPVMLIEKSFSEDSSVELVLEKIKKNNDFYATIRTLEYLAMQAISSNSQEWFGKAVGIDKIRSMFKSCLDSPQTLQGNFLMKTRKDKGMKCYNVEKEVILEEDIELGSGLVVIVKIYGILFGKSIAKLDIRCQKIAVVKVVEKPKPEEDDTPPEPEPVVEESDYDSDMEFNFDPLKPPSPPPPSQTDPEETLEIVEKNEADTCKVRLDMLVEEMDKYMKIKDFSKVQDISQEIVNLQKLISSS